MHEYCEKVNRWVLNRQIFLFYCINYFPCQQSLGRVRSVCHARDVSLLLSTQFVKQIPSLLERWITNAPVKLRIEKKCLSLHCCKIKSNLFVCLLGICQVFSVSCKIVLVTTNCCFTRSDIMFHSSFLRWAIVDWTCEVQHGLCKMLWSQSSSNWLYTFHQIPLSRFREWRYITTHS
jgi:hypothetical protein